MSSLLGGLSSSGITGSLLSWLYRMDGLCTGLPCVGHETAEQAELMQGEMADSKDDLPEFDSIKLLSYNIFIRTFPLLPHSRTSLRSAGAQVYA